MFAGFGLAEGAAVAHADPYPSADVQVGANYPQLCKHRVQGAGVKCYEDGSWATGNYSTNRWFLVYVTRTGSSWAFWGYVHASYVYNQPRVVRC